MNDKSDAKAKSGATQDSIGVRLFEHGDNKKIADIDSSLKGVTIYMWRSIPVPASRNKEISWQ